MSALAVFRTYVSPIEVLDALETTPKMTYNLETGKGKRRFCHRGDLTPDSYRSRPRREGDHAEVLHRQKKFEGAWDGSLFALTWTALSGPGWPAAPKILSAADLFSRMMEPLEDPSR